MASTDRWIREEVGYEEQSQELYGFREIGFAAYLIFTYKALLRHLEYRIPCELSQKRLNIHQMFVDSI